MPLEARQVQFVNQIQLLKLESHGNGDYVDEASLKILACFRTANVGRSRLFGSF